MTYEAPAWQWPNVDAERAEAAVVLAERDAALAEVKRLRVALDGAATVNACLADEIDVVLDGGEVMPAIIIESRSPVEAIGIGALHLALSPDHEVEVVHCPNCGDEIGLWCRSCIEPLCAIASVDCDSP